MFSFQQSDDKPVFQISTTTQQQDLILPDASLDDSTLLNYDKGKGRQRKSLATLDNSELTDNNDRKMMHREMERQRRKEMGKLHGSLRSLLPLEYIKVNILNLYFVHTLSFLSSPCTFLL